MMTIDQIHQLDIGLQKVVRKVANGYGAGNFFEGDFFIKFTHTRGTKEINITITKDFVRKAPDAKV